MAKEYETNKKVLKDLKARAKVFWKKVAENPDRAVTCESDLAENLGAFEDKFLTVEEYSQED
jgi:hypothetical protein